MIIVRRKMMKLPELTKEEDGIVYSDWVIGEYPGNECPTRIVRCFVDKTGFPYWEVVMGEIPDEDFYSIDGPVRWIPIPRKG
jgi:hypothetical protein